MTCFRDIRHIACGALSTTHDHLDNVYNLLLIYDRNHIQWPYNALPDFCCLPLCLITDLLLSFIAVSSECARRYITSGERCDFRYTARSEAVTFIPKSFLVFTLFIDWTKLLPKWFLMFYFILSNLENNKLIMCAWRSWVNLSSATY